MVDDKQKHQTIFPTLDNAVDAAAKYRFDYDRANTEYNRFHARSDPAAQLAEQAAYADPRRMNPTFVNARNPRVFRNTQYSPNYPGDKYTTQFTVGSSGGTRGLESLPRNEYYDDMKGLYDFFMDEMYKPDVRRDMGLEPYPDDSVMEIDYEVEEPVEEERGLFGLLQGKNPFDLGIMNDMFRERRMEELRRRMMDRMMEENLRLQMEWSNEMLMNPNKFNLTPGTGEENPIFGEPYWNI